MTTPIATMYPLRFVLSAEQVAALSGEAELRAIDTERTRQAIDRRDQVVYLYITGDDTVTSWYGEPMGRVVSGRMSRGRYARTRAVRAVLLGGAWHGRYSCDNQTLCRFHPSNGAWRS